jgi:hypothetical protein
MSICTTKVNQALGEHEGFFIIRSEDFPILQTLLGLRVARRILYSSTRNRRSVSTVTVWSGIRIVFIPKIPTLTSAYSGPPLPFKKSLSPVGRRPRNRRIVVASRTVRRATRLSSPSGLLSVTSFSAPPWDSRRRPLVDALALSVLTALVAYSRCRPFLWVCLRPLAAGSRSPGTAYGPTDEREEQG